MADAADYANERMAHLIEGSLARRKRFQGVSHVFCIECDAEIPERRREALPGVELCVECQQLQEARNHEHARHRP